MGRKHLYYLSLSTVAPPCLINSPRDSMKCILEFLYTAANFLFAPVLPRKRLPSPSPLFLKELLMFILFRHYHSSVACCVSNSKTLAKFLQVDYKDIILCLCVCLCVRVREDVYNSGSVL